MLIRNLSRYATNLLIALNSLIAFLLVFNSEIVVPKWLQPAGRLHPLLLHFPIVILMMAMVLEWFRSEERIRQQELIQHFITLLWLVGALSAAATVIMGILLSKEPGYEGSTLEWHKWLGASVVLLSSAIVWCRKASWYSITVARSASLASALGLIVAGHFGADLTHGANFVLQPILKSSKEGVSIDQAVVFSDVIQPIFDNKCISCHNADKQKGGLMLVDEKSILKGGRNGKLFETGQPEVSLLLRRIHLPDGEKEHMPPKGKPPLTEEEAKLLYLWIKEKVNFDKKVIDLPLDDSLRQLAAAVLKPAGKTEDEYDFAAADEKLIKKLNNNYRSVSVMGRESPALGINIYNRKNYDHKVLEELSPIQKQVVSLYLDHMPVKDPEIKEIAKFENLRSLNLNFTDITGVTLQELAALKHLKSLSLSGTRLSPDAAKQIGQLKNVQNVILWNCGLKPDQIAQLKESNKNISYTEGFKDDGRPIKLNLPQLKTSPVFSNGMLLQLTHPINGVEMRYTTDGSQPDSLVSPLYKPGIVFSQNNISLKVRAYKAGWISSDVATFDFHKSTYTPDSISFLKFPSFQSSPQRAISLIDKELGSGFTADGKWIGSQKDVVLYVEFASPADLKVITISSLRDNLPGEIEIWSDANKSDPKLLSKVIPKTSPDPNAGVTRSIECKLPRPYSGMSLKIVIKPAGRRLQSGKMNQSPYFFLDEIFFN